jgi:hypothetical protein
MKTQSEKAVNIRLKLMGLWITLMLLYIYCDIYSFFRTGLLEEIAAGKIGLFDVSQGMLVVTGVLMIIPALMVPVCLFLKEKAVKWVSVIVGIVYTLVNVGNIVGETWAYYWIYGIIELVFTIGIVIFALKWKAGDNGNG